MIKSIIIVFNLMDFAALPTVCRIIKYMYGRSVQEIPSAPGWGYYRGMYPDHPRTKQAYPNTKAPSHLGQLLAGQLFGTRVCG